MESQDTLARQINDPDETVRLYAVDDIMSLKSSNWAQALMDRLKKESSPVVRDALVFALKKSNNPLIYETIFELYSSADAYLRNSAVAILSAYGLDTIVFLGSKLDHANKEVRKLILDTLVELGTEDAIFALRAALYDPAINVVITAVEYLGRLNDRASIPEMIDLFSHTREPMLKDSILETLSELANAEDIESLLLQLSVSADKAPDSQAIYIPSLLKLATRGGFVDTIFHIIDSLTDPILYGEDIIKSLYSIQNLVRQHPLPEQTVRLLHDIVLSPDLRIEYQFYGIELIDQSESALRNTYLQAIADKAPFPDIREFCQTSLGTNPGEDNE